MGSADLGRHQEAEGEAEGIESGHKRPKPASQHNTINVRHRTMNHFRASHRIACLEPKDSHSNGIVYIGGHAIHAQQLACA